MSKASETADKWRRANLRGNDSCATNAEIRVLLANADSCKYCSLSFDEIRKPTLDHIIPLSKGGPHSLTNLAAACAPCNSKKGAKLNYAVDFT